MRRWMAIAAIVFWINCLWAGHWAQEFVDASFRRAVGSGAIPSVAVDAEGNPHVAFADTTSDVLIYAHKVRDTWHIEVVDTGGGIGHAPEIGLDPEGIPHIVYYSHPSNLSVGLIKYASKRNGVWNLETIDTSASPQGLYPSLFIDAHGVVYIAYVDNGETMHVARRTASGGWDRSEVSTFNWNVLLFERIRPALAVNEEGFMYVLYREYENPPGVYTLSLGIGDPAGAWSEVDVSSNADAAHYDLALDGQGNVHVVYADSVQSSIVYGYRSGGTWTYETIASASYIGAFYGRPSIVVDPQGVPHVFYSKAGDLVHAYKSGGTWYYETVKARTVLTGTDVVLDHRNGFHGVAAVSRGGSECYPLYVTTALRLLTPRGGELWHSGETQEVRWFGEGPVDLYFSPDGTHYELLASGITGGFFPVVVPDVVTDHAFVKILRTEAPQAWDLSPEPFQIAPRLPEAAFRNIPVDTLDDRGKYTSLALDAHGNPHISYFDYTNGELRYAYREDGVWHTMFVDAPSSATVGQYTSLALDSGGNPHISYYDASNGDLKYAFRRPDGYWFKEVVDASGDVGEYTSIALDANGNPHISYFDYTHGSLKYAYKVDNTWHIETVDNTATTVGMFTSLALDAEGNPHIAYYDFSNGDLKYAYKAGAVWVLETVDPQAGGHVSLSLDLNGTPHISYMGGGNVNLRYAYREDGIWHIETVDETSLVGYYTSLEVDRAGRPHISYYDWGNTALKYAFKADGTWHLQTLESSPSVGTFTSLALDAHGNPHISYYDATNGDLRYTTRALDLISPVGGETWTVGANATLRWGGPRKVDVYLSLHGGDEWQPLLEGITGTMIGNEWRYSFQVPHLPTHYAKVKVVYAGYDPTVPVNFAVSDTFFTIQATVTLLAFNAEIGNDGKVHLAWQTDPGPGGLRGYHVYRLNADGTEERLTASPVQETEFVDDPLPGIRGYALGAVNGLGTEYRIGEVQVTALKRPVEILPSVARNRSQVLFYVPALFSRDGKQQVKVRVVDLQGRVLRVLLEGRLEPGVHGLEASWQGLPEGTYFVVVTVNREYQKTARFQVLR